MTTIELSVTPIIHGSMGYSTTSQKQQIRTIHCGIDHGITSIDTAPLYGAGKSEETVGKAIVGRREEVQILSKCGLNWDDSQGLPLFNMTVDGKVKTVRIDCRGLSLEREIDRSLRRLGTDYIDLLQIHQFDSNTPLFETISALDKIKRSGKIREIGVCNFSLKQVLSADKYLDGGIFSVQNELNLINIANLGMAKKLKNKRIIFIAYSPLAQGLLASLNSIEKFPGRFGSAFSLDNFANIQNVLTCSLLPIAENYRVSLAQLCLSWTLNKEGVGAIITGASSEEQCLENAVSRHIKLKPSDIGKIEEALSAIRLNMHTHRLPRLNKVKSKIGRFLKLQM